MADGSRIPRIVVEPSAARSLPLSAADGFVFSRIDGKASERELAALTGLPELQIKSSLDKLFGLKAIAFGPAPTAAEAAALPPGATGAPSDPKLLAAPAPAAANSLLAAAIAGIAEDAPELTEEVDLPLDLRRRVLGLHSVVTSLDHYALLGIPRDVDKKGVKRSYFELAAVFHPDRYFRKNLGSFKSKMEVIFGKVSVAYETLTDKEQRAEYDVYLGDIEKSQGVESMLRDVMAEVARAEQSILEAASDAGVSSQPVPSMPPTGSYSSVLPRAPTMRPDAGSPIPTPAPTPAKPSVADQLRREALAMRLKGVGRPAQKVPTPAPVRSPLTAPPPSLSSVDAMQAVKRRYEDKVEAGRRSQAQKYVTLAETAESRNDLTAAAAAYRVALSFLREGEAAFAHAKEVIAKSELSLGETYVRQAEHEEKGSRWEDSARSWGRAVKLRPLDHRAHERYAHALVQARGDLHEAAQIAQKAVAMAPTVGDYRCTLAGVYAAAGLALNAKRELESAALQFPENPNIPVLLKKLTKVGP